MERVPLNPGDSLQVEVWISHKHEKAGPILRALNTSNAKYPPTDADNFRALNHICESCDIIHPSLSTLTAALEQACWNEDLEHLSQPDLYAELMKGDDTVIELTLAVNELNLALVQNFVSKMGSQIGTFDISLYSSAPHITEFKPLCQQNPVKITTLLSIVPLLEELSLDFEDFLLGKYDSRRLAKSFPNLYELTTTSLLQEGSSPSLLASIIRRSPNLKFLHFTFNYGQDRLSISKLPQLLYEPPGRVPPLLSLMIVLENRDLEALNDFNSRRFNKLANLVAYILEDISVELLVAFNYFLHYQEDSLEELRVFIRRDSDAMSEELCLPKLEKLRKLVLSNPLLKKNVEILPAKASVSAPDVSETQSPKLFSTLRPIIYGQFPSLKTLELVCYQPNWFPNIAVLSSLEELILSHNTPYLPNNTFFHLNFPNLKSLILKIFPSVPFLEYILLNFTRLKALDLGTASEHGLDMSNTLWRYYTGGAFQVPEEEVITTRAGGTEEGGKRRIRAIRRRRACPSFANFKNLTHLTLPVWSALEVQALVHLTRLEEIGRLEILTIRYYYEWCEPLGTAMENIIKFRKYRKELRRYHKKLKFTLHAMNVEAEEKK